MLLFTFDNNRLFCHHEKHLLFQIWDKFTRSAFVYLQSELITRENVSYTTTLIIRFMKNKNGSVDSEQFTSYDLLIWCDVSVLVIKRIHARYTIFGTPPLISPPLTDLTGNPYGVYGSVITYRIHYRIFLKSCKFLVSSTGHSHKNRGGGANNKGSGELLKMLQVPPEPGSMLF